MPRLMLALIASMITMSLPASSPERARLVVGIMVDGLDNDCLELLQSRFGSGGLNRLSHDGVVILNADYGTPLDAAAATAMFVTGASPSISGIPGERIYNREKLRTEEIFIDPSTLGNFTGATYSPARLLTSTLSDEARIAAGGINAVYAIAADPAQAIILAGHSANCGIWLDSRTGNWASSTFYKEMPTAVSARNRLKPLSMRLDTMSWTPALQPSQYPDLPDHLGHYPFRYVFPHGNAGRFEMFAQSALINTEITDIAIDLLNGLSLGSHEGVDVLNLSYNLTPYPYTKGTDSRFEQMDSYIRLDRQLERLFNAVDGRLGKDKALIVLAGTPRSNSRRRDDERWNIPYGEFSTRKAISLLNLYLMALHGNGDYVEAYHDGAFYLNHKLIKEKSLDLGDLRRESAEFLVRMHGVRTAYTLDDIISRRAGDNPDALRRNTHIASAGDIVITLLPGFDLIDDSCTPASSGRVQQTLVQAAPVAPVFILAPDVDPRTIDTPTDIRVVAPTVARLLRIRSPNGAALAPLNLSR